MSNESKVNATQNMIRPLVRGVYDAQKLRIEMGNRLCANFKAKLGVEPSVSEDEQLAPDAEELLKTLKIAYKNLGTAVAEFKKMKNHSVQFTGNEVISDFTELCLVEQYLDLEDQERRSFKRILTVLESVPVYTQYLSKVKGIGPAMAGVIISEIDIHKATYPSSIWMYAGLDVAADGRGRSRRDEHLVERAYVDKEGVDKVRKGITFNPWLKTKLVGVLAPSFLRAGNEQYRAVYDGYKNRLENHARYGLANEATLKSEMAEKGFKKYSPKSHRHNMAMRYVVKIFLIDLHREWRKLEGLPESIPYHVAKLGMRNHAA